MPQSHPLQLQAPPPLHTGSPSPASSGVPIHHVRFPASPSPLPAWLSGSSPPPVYTAAGNPPLPTLPSPTAGGFARPLEDRTGAPGHAANPPPPPRYAKVDFATFDGSEDPLNWLSQCEQLFRGQRTLASDRTWLASYHLRGAAQTWYYALEQDEGGMPP